MLGYLSADIREFKLYDATVTKSSLKIASSSLSIFSIVMQICLTFETSGTTHELNLEVRCKSQGRKFKLAAVFTFSVKLEKWSFHVADLPRTGKKCTEMKKAREGRAKLLFCFIKYAKFVALSLPSRRRS